MYNAFRVILSELAKRFERLPLLDGWFDRLPLKRNRRFDEQVRPLLRHRGCGCGCEVVVVGGERRAPLTPALAVLGRNHRRRPITGDRWPC